MLSYISVTERIISDIKKIDSKVDTVKLKDLVLELADHIAQGIDEQRPEIIAKFKTILAQDTLKPRGQEEITHKLISLLIQKIANQNFTTISYQWIIKCLPDKYKETKIRNAQPKMIHSSDISDAELLNIGDDLKRRLRKIENLGPAKEIKIKNTEEGLKEHVWGCYMAEELVKLAMKLENEHASEHDDKYCKSSAQHIRIARDKRYATTFSRYHAIVIQAEHTRSLSDLAGDEVEVLTRWEVNDNEKGCNECIDLIHCRAEKCNHICHNFKKEMTTKGIKWAQRETQELASLKKQVDRLYGDTNDMCDMMKMVFISPTLKMTQGDKKDLMAKHIKIDDCDVCLYFIGQHPNFYREHLE